MAALALDAEQAKGPKPGVSASNARRFFWLMLAAAALFIVVLCSIAIGAKDIPLSTVIGTLLHGGDSDDAAIVLALRLPRTILGILVGVALGLSGALIQGLTRNPLADPGILGVNAGATLFVVLAVGLFGVSSISFYIWFALAGAVAATIIVYAVGSVGRGSATPIRLTLAGIAIGAVLTGISNGLSLLDPATFDRLRFWNAGSLTAPGYDGILVALPFIGVGTLLAIAATRPLNAVALGDDLAASLGTNIARTRAIVVVAVTLLAGAATAVAGPIGFVGLMIPHVARWIGGPDQRWIAAYTIVLSPILLLVSDIAGRVVMRPGELQVGVVTAFVGAPVLILLARRRKVSGL